MKIELKQVRKAFDNKELFSISHCIFEKGKTYGIIGSNGIGKTTLLRMIGGMDQTYEGMIRYDTDTFSDALLKQMSFIDQQPFMLDRSVYENLAYPLRVRKVDRNVIQSKVSTWLKRMDIEQLKDRNAKLLSAGEKQKVSLARGLIYKPELVLLDEPTANIDPDTVFVMEEILSNYQEATNATMIWVTHNIRQAWKSCDSVLLMQSDRVKWIGKEMLKQKVETAMYLETALKIDDE